MHQIVMERCRVDVGADMAQLEVNPPHAGGTFPWLIGRLDHGTRVCAELKHMKRMPSEYLRRFSYDTIVSKNAAGRPEVSDLVNWLREEAKKEPR